MEMQRCWHKCRLVKLFAFCLPDRIFAHFLLVFLLFLFTKWPNLWSNKCVIAKRKRPPLVRGHHWSPASTLSEDAITQVHFDVNSHTFVSPSADSRGTVVKLLAKVCARSTG